MALSAQAAFQLKSSWKGVGPEDMRGQSQGCTHWAAPSQQLPALCAATSPSPDFEKPQS